MKNKLSDLNNHLFAMIEKLGEDDLTGERLSEEIQRAKAVTDIAGQIIANGNLILKAHITKNDKLYGIGKLPLQLTE